MKAKRYAVFFVILFSLFLITPSIINMIQDTAAISHFFDIAEEEKKGEAETAEHTLVLTSHPENYHRIYKLSKRSNKHCCTPDNYLEIVLDKHCPPPERV